MFKKLRPWIKSLSALFVNLSAVWITLAIITPNFSNNDPEANLILTVDLVLAILFLLASVSFESVLENE